jgi:hypothetical protein
MSLHDYKDRQQQQILEHEQQQEAELVATLIDSPPFLHPVRATGINADDFTSMPMRLAFAAVLQLGADGKDITHKNIADQIRRCNPDISADAITQAAYTLPASAVTMRQLGEPQVVEVAKEICQRARARQLASMLSEQSRHAQSGALVSIVAADVISKTIDLVSSQWPEPQPLADVLPPVTALNLEWLPPLAATFVSDVARRTSSPPDMVTAILMVAIGGTIGRRALIKMRKNDSWREVPNMWGMLVARPGDGKTPATAPVMQMLDAIEKELYGDWNKSEAQRAVKRDELAERQKQLSKDLASAIKEGMDVATEQAQQIAFASQLRELVVPRPRLIVRDATPESLQDILCGSPAGITCVRDELGGFIAELDKSGRELQRSLYVQGWNGNGRHTMDRRQAVSTDIEAVTIALFGNIQPGPLRELVLKSSRGVGDDGFLQRFSFLVFPDPVPLVDVDVCPNQMASNEVLSMFRKVSAFGIAAAGREPSVEFASTKWSKYIHSTARNSRDKESPALQAWWSKINKPFAALALIGHLFRYQGELAECLRHPICDEDAERAKILVVDYLASHVSRIFAGADLEADDSRFIGQLIEDGELGPALPCAICNNVTAPGLRSPCESNPLCAAWPALAGFACAASKPRAARRKYGMFHRAFWLATFRVGKPQHELAGQNNFTPDRQHSCTEVHKTPFCVLL